MGEPSLLPQSPTTPWEFAQSETDAARYPLPTRLIKDVWRPDTCPVELLPYLAAGLGLEIWRDGWSEERKRDVVADIWRLKRNKTKLKGIAGYLELEDAELLSAHRPRDRFWWSGGQSQAQRDATTALMPRIRIFPVAGPESGSPAKAFWSGRQVKQFWRARRFLAASDAAARYAGRAVYVDNGVSTPVTVRGVDGLLDSSVLIELAAPASPQKLFWGARVWGRAAWLGSDAGEHVLAVTPTQSAAAFAVPSGLTPTEVRPVRVAEEATASVAKAFWGRSAWGQCAFMASDAADHLADEVTLFDSTRLTPTRQPMSFWGYSRWAARPYTAEIRVDVTVARPARAFAWGQPWGGEFWRRSDMTPFWSALRAVRIAKAERDFIWIDTRLYQPVRFTPGLRFGDVGFTRFGDQRKLS